MQNLEPLKRVGSFGLSSSDIEDGVDEFRAFSVVSLGPVVSGTALSLSRAQKKSTKIASVEESAIARCGGSYTHVDECIRPEQIAHASTLDVVEHGRFEINLDGTRHILLVGDFIKVDRESVELEV